MPLAALILGDSDGSSGSDAARLALLPVAGQSLIEFQARSAHAAGASHILVMVDALPGALVAAFDRLRDEGLTVDVARDVRDAADRVHPDEDLLIFSAGTIADRDVIGRFVSHAAPAILTLAEAPALEQFERIDGYIRWSGLALLKGEHLRSTANMLGDWSLGPTLLRVAIQHDAARVQLEEDLRIEKVSDEKQAHSVSRRLAQTTLVGPLSPFDRLTAHMAALGAASAMTRVVPFDFVQLFAPGLFLLAVTLGWFAMPGFGFTVFVVGVFAGACASRYAAAAIRQSRLVRWRFGIEQVALLLLMLCTAAHTWRGAGWGVIALALWMSANALVIYHAARWEPRAGDLALILLLALLADAVVLGLTVCVVWQLAAVLAPRLRLQL